MGTIYEVDANGIKVPRLTTTERNAIASPTAGQQIFNTTTNTPNYYNGTAWIEVDSADDSLQKSYDGGSDVLLDATRVVTIHGSGIPYGNNNLAALIVSQGSQLLGNLAIGNPATGGPTSAGAVRILGDTAITFPAADRVDFGVNLATLAIPGTVPGVTTDLINGTLVTIKDSNVSGDEGTYLVVGFDTGITTNSIAILIDLTTFSSPTFTSTSGTAEIANQLFGFAPTAGGTGGPQNAFIGLPGEGDGTQPLLAAFSDSGNYDTIFSAFNTGDLTTAMVSLLNFASTFGGVADVPFLAFVAPGAVPDNGDLVWIPRTAHPSTAGMAAGTSWYRNDLGTFYVWDGSSILPVGAGGATLQSAYVGGETIVETGFNAGVNINGPGLTGYENATGVFTFLVDGFNGLMDNLTPSGGPPCDFLFHKLPTLDDAPFTVPTPPSVGPVTDIAFNDTNPDTITSTTTNFVTAGFVAGDGITVSGSTSNDGTYTIATVAATTITLIAGDTLTTEAAGASVTITAFADRIDFGAGVNLVTAGAQVSGFQGNFSVAVVFIKTTNNSADLGAYLISSLADGAGTNSQAVLTSLGGGPPGLTATSGTATPANQIKVEGARQNFEFGTASQNLLTPTEMRVFLNDGLAIQNLLKIYNFPRTGASLTALSHSMLFLNNLETSGNSDVPLLYFSQSANHGDYRMTPRASDPTGLGAGDDGAFYYNTSTTELKLWDGAAWLVVGPSTGSGTLQDAYDNGNTIVTAGALPVSITVPIGSNNVALLLTQNNTTNNPVVLSLVNTGTGNDITATNWSISKGGIFTGAGATLTPITDTSGLNVTSTAATSHAITVTKSAGTGAALELNYSSAANEAGLRVIHSGSGDAVTIDNNGTGDGIFVDATLGNDSGIRIQGGPSTGLIVNTTGTNNSLFQHSGSGVNVSISHTGNDSGLDALTSTGASAADSFIKLRAGNAAFDQTLLYLSQAGTGSTAIGLEMDTGSPNAGWIKLTQSAAHASSAGDSVLSVRALSTSTIGQVLYVNTFADGGANNPAVLFESLTATNDQPVLQISQAGTGYGIEVSGNSHFGGAQVAKVTAVAAASYAILDNDYIIGVNFAGAVTLTLPDPTNVSGKIIIVKDESGAGATNNITIDPFGAELIDGAASLIITANYGAARLYTNGTDWFTI